MHHITDLTDVQKEIDHLTRDNRIILYNLNRLSELDYIRESLTEDLKYQQTRLEVIQAFLNKGK